MKIQIIHYICGFLFRYRQLSLQTNRLILSYIRAEAAV